MAISETRLAGHSHMTKKSNGPKTDP